MEVYYNRMSCVCVHEMTKTCRMILVKYAMKMKALYEGFTIMLYIWPSWANEMTTKCNSGLVEYT